MLRIGCYSITITTAVDNGDGEGSPYAMSPFLYNLMHIEAPKYMFRDSRTGYHRVGEKNKPTTNESRQTMLQELNFVHVHDLMHGAPCVHV